MELDRPDTILIVDDNINNLQVLAQTLHEANYRVIVAQDGSSALTRLEHTTPDLILLDIMMPGMDGFELYERIRERERIGNIPIIFLSACSDAASVVNGFRLNAADYITKPFRSEEVLARVDKHLALQRLHKELERKNARLEWEIGERKRAEALLRESETKFRTLTESAQDAIILLDNRGRISVWNRAAETMFGYTQTEAIGRELHALIVSDQTNEAFRQGLAHFRATGQGQMVGKVVEMRAIRRDGGEFPVEVSIAAVRLQGEWYAIGVIRDITARKEAELSLQQAYHDLARQVTRLKLLNEITQTVAASTDLSTVLERVANLVALLLNSDDTVILLLDDSQTELRIAASYLSSIKSEQWAGRVFPVAGDAVAERILIDRQSSLVCRQAEGGPSEVARCFLQEGPATCLAAVGLQTRGHVIGLIILTSRQPDRVFHKQDVDLVETVAGQTAAAIENARLFAEEHRHRQRVEHQNKELDAFARMVAHDIKNPLGIVVTYSDFLVQSAGSLDKETLLENLKAIRQAGYKGANIVNELLLLAGVRKWKVSMLPLEMDFIVEQAQQRLSLMIEEYQGELITPAAWPVALGHGPWVEEVWINYLSNGLKYGGRPPRLELGGEVCPEGMVRFWVRDNGAGLTPVEQAQLFTEFTRLDEIRAQGHGLGLSIVRRIVDRLGGQVGVESEPEKGSLFYFTLPSAPA